MKLKNYLKTQMKQFELAEKLGITPGAVSQWLVKEKIPAERVLQIERATNGQVTRYEMRPDLYPRKNSAA